jgi:proteic killer suppression protein
MVRSFRHRGLKALYDGRTTRRVAPEHLAKLRDILALLDRSRRPRDMDLRSAAGHFPVSVSGNWRVTFRFEEGDAIDVDYVDYH